MQQLSRLGMAVLMAVLFMSSCKKDDHVDPQKPADLAGKFSVFEIEQYNPVDTVYAMPNDGTSGEINVTVADEKNASIQLLLMANGDTAANTIVDCTIVKDTDGFYAMQNKSDGKLAAYFYDKNEMDLFAVPGYRLGAKR